MLRTKEEVDYFNELVEIKNNINKQIPLAQNRFEEFECPTLSEGENEHDIDIQFHMHEGLLHFIYFQYQICDELIEIHQDYLNDNNLAGEKTLSKQDIQKLELILSSKIKAILDNFSRTWSIFKIDLGIDAESLKEKVISSLRERILLLCSGSPDALSVHEDQLIANYFDDLRSKFLSIIKRIKKSEDLSDDEIHLVDIYRRENVAHEEVVTAIYTDVNRLKHKFIKKISVPADIIDIFENDVLFNIDKLQSKIINRKHTYVTRYKLAKSLREIRDTLASNFCHTALLDTLKTGELSDIGRIEKKSILSVIKSEKLQAGLLYKLQKLDSGLCDEHKSLALVEILGQALHFNHTVEEVIITYNAAGEDGHTFLVIDRAKGSLPNDMSTWGDKAILFDAWHHLVCYVNDLGKSDIIYKSFPIDAKWKLREYGKQEATLLHELSSLHSNFTAINCHDPAVREERIIEEFELTPLDKNHALHHYLMDII